MKIGPVGSALNGAPVELRKAVRGALREVFERHQGPRGVTFPSAVWLVRARRPG